MGIDEASDLELKTVMTKTPGQCTNNDVFDNSLQDALDEKNEASREADDVIKR